MKKYLLLSLLFVLSCAMALAQRTVSGTITDASTGEGIPGVNVVIKGTSSGTVSDFEGNYSLEIPSDDAVLVYSFVGYRTLELTAGARGVVDVQLELDVTELAEVVVIGYGQIEQSDATGAVAAVTAEDFNQGMIASPEQLIAGKTAGVQITSTSGAPGDGVQLRIRGTTSIRSNNNPLFVVDGVPLAGGTQPGSADVGFGTASDVNPLNFINPNDIESISILKDASATAIYGSRGANGVVIITTKSGKGQKGSWEFGTNVSISSPRSEYDLLDREEFLDAVEQFGGDRVARDQGSDTDWQDVVTRTTISHKTNLAFSKAGTGGSIRASIGYEDQQGVVENSFMKRFTGRINGSKSLMGDKLKLTLTSTYSRVDREDPAISGNAGFAGDLLGAAYSANPTWPNDPDADVGNQRNPANMLAYYSSTGFTNRILTNLSADYSLADGLTAKLTYGNDYSDAERLTLMTGDVSNVGDGIRDNGFGQLNFNSNVNHLFEATLNLNKKVGNVQIDVVGGYSVQSFNDRWSWVTGVGFTDYSGFDVMEDELRTSNDAMQSTVDNNYDYDFVTNWGVSDNLSGDAATQPTTGGFVSGVNNRTLVQEFFNRPSDATIEAMTANFYDRTDYLQSYFARANFTISEKYLITATLRADGSSRFGGDNRYGIFPSGAVAWKIHEEAFMPESVSTLKLRAGYGVVGNQDGLSYGQFTRVQRYADASVSTNNRFVTIPGSDATGQPDPRLKWESTTQTSIGLDFGFAQDKIYGSIDYYIKETSDLLLRAETAQPALDPQFFKNLDGALVENKGWELSLTYNVYASTQGSVSLTGNVSKNDNLLTNFNGQMNAGQIYGQGLTGAYAQRLAGDQPLFSYYLREFEGFDPEGQPIGDNQMFIGKGALPVWNSGLSVNAEYKNWSLSAYMYGQFGHYIYNNTQNGFFTAGAINNARNVTQDVVTSGEAGSAEAAVSTRFLHPGDFWRMQNLIIAYNIPVSGNSFFRNMKVNFNAQNLFVITDYNGLDPEVSSNPAEFNLLNNLPTAGIDYTAYPRPRIFSIGFSAGF